MEKIPKFKTDEEASRFREAHSFQEYNRDTKEAGVKFIRRPKKTIPIRFDSEET